MEIEETRKKLVNNIEIYIKSIIDRYGSYIPKYKLDELNSIKDYNKIIQIYDTGSVNAYATSDNVIMPLCADRLLKLASKVPLYGIYKNHRSYNENTLVSNNNTFINYLFHAFVSGTDAEGYYEDMLLHETMHFCGSGGATALKEGINELLTRKLALENGFRTNGCGYPKEVKIALRLQETFGEDIIDQIAFINYEQGIYQYLQETLGMEAAELYINVSQLMEKEFDEKYYSDMDNYNGLSGIMKKTINYRKIDYSRIERMLNEYQLNYGEGKKSPTK